MAQNERLQRAMDRVDAVRLDDGRYAYYADETSAWYVVEEGELGDLCDYLDHEDAEIRRDAYSHWCAGTSSEEMPRGWEPGKSVYTYTLFDGPDGSTWPSHKDVTIVADSDEAAVQAVREILESEAAGLDPADGYEVGHEISAHVWDADQMIVGQPTYTLEAQDLEVVEPGIVED